MEGCTHRTVLQGCTAVYPSAASSFAPSTMSQHYDSCSLCPLIIIPCILCLCLSASLSCLLSPLPLSHTTLTRTDATVAAAMAMAVWATTARTGPRTRVLPSSTRLSLPVRKVRRDIAYIRAAARVHVVQEFASLQTAASVSLSVVYFDDCLLLLDCRSI